MSIFFGICLSLVYVAPSVDSCKFAVACTWLLTYVPSSLWFLHFGMIFMALVFGICLSLMYVAYVSLLCGTICCQSHTHGLLMRPCLCACVPTMDILFSGIWLEVPTVHGKLYGDLSGWLH